MATRKNSSEKSAKMKKSEKSAKPASPAREKSPSAKKSGSSIKPASIATGKAPTASQKKPIHERFLSVLGWTLWIITSYFLANFIMAAVIIFLRHYGLIDLGNLSTITTFIINTSMFILIFVIAVLIPMRRRNKRLQKSVGGSVKELAKNPENNPTEAKITLKSVLGQVGLSRGVKLIDIRYFLADLPVFYVVNIVVAGLATYLLGSEIMGQDQNIGFAMTGNATWQLVLIFITVVIVAPVIEEVVMRGFLFEKIRKNIPFWPTAILISLIFAAAHGQINVGIMTFIMSMFCCWIREKTGAIWGAIFLHMFVNGLAFFLLFVI